MFKLRCVILIGLSVVCVGLCGCNSATPAQTAKDNQSFKGGPMPPEARQKMEEAIRQAKERSANSASAQH